MASLTDESLTRTTSTRTPASDATTSVDQYSYDDSIVRSFLTATVLWGLVATLVGLTVAVLHVFNNLVVPIGLGKCYPIYAGVQDAFMQWWYGHNAVAFFLTTPFLGLMYYFLPKAAERPVFSYKLSIIHFWSLVFIYTWAGPHHLHYSALPAWAC